jgi:glycine oxidase
VIVGGGVIGLSIAYAIAREGVRCTVLDKAEMGRAASWAGAGMIAPVAEGPPTHALGALRSLSARLYPDWSAALREETGIDNGYRKNGGVDAAFTALEDEALRTLAGRWREEGIAFERLEGNEYRRVEPALNPALRVAYYLPDRAQIRNPRHLKALAAAAAQRGTVLRPGVAAFDCAMAAGRLSAVETSEGRMPCGSAIVAAGPWSSQLLERCGINAPTPPIKGEIVLLRGSRPILTRIVEHGKKYLVPRDDGRVLVGATEEDVGFDTRSTPSAVRDLLDEALRLCPALADTEVERTWAGLRPGSIDSRPYVGPAPGVENLLIATGHKRAGLQLAPATAEIVADQLLGRQPRIPLEPFRVDRDPAPLGEESVRS